MNSVGRVGTEALKALVARGAVLTAPPRSKLLRRVAQDGQALWLVRVLEGVQRSYPLTPDPVVLGIAAFLGCRAPEVPAKKSQSLDPCHPAGRIQIRKSMAIVSAWIQLLRKDL